MSNIQAFILGIIQGLTEFLPISSTGHLFIGRHLFGLDEAGLFLDTMLHVGTLLAVLVVYKDDLLHIVKHPFSKLTKIMIVGTIPAVIAGFLFKDFFDSISKSGVTIGWEFLATGAILWWAEASKKNGSKKLEDIRYSDALIIGTFQAAAIFPALSRSGLTIAAGLVRKLDRETAAYFSFLLSTPAILGGIVLQGKDLFTGQAESISLTSLLFGTIASAIFGYFAIVGMINFLKKKSLKIFAYYVWGLGLFIITLQMIGIF
ncbi:undecaprenyl-diphosphate phosphatase [Bacillus sp. FJAT-49736]|uniref:undecaprenyl-diphosphate phosphatase n=1 Tax=Bacillus sp. FJAT-49736 TaxID=2833582 RepID=UPI001BCA05E3|nr:undecaprenyl-diphosphate phosphatase [Bacillus sp. FJAT-49736]MBS4173175.1 undecaprenyl-diphosphate phosphatase [Bacillus sp. FJAT-49736]